MSKIMSTLRKAGLFINVIYLIGWLIALIGLAMGQDWCKDHLQLYEQLPEPLSYTFLAHVPGSKCHKLYRFPWFIWVLCTLPVLMSIAHLVKPTLVRGGSAALFAVLAVFQCMAANTFNDLIDSPIAMRFSDVQKANKVRVTGFSLMAAMSLLMIVLESFIGEEPPRERAVHGGRADAPVASEATREGAAKV